MFEPISILTIFAIGLLGLLIGSFGNVLIYRLPEGKNVVSDRSRCRNCHKVIAWYDNIPVVSYLMLRGKCRECKAKVSLRYPLVELLTSFLFMMIYFKTGATWLALEYYIFVFGLIVITFIDLDHYIIPDVMSLPGILLGLLGAFLNPEREFVTALWGVLLGGGFLWAVAYFYEVFRKQEGMGGGDIKLLAWIGAVLGWPAIPFVILSSSIVGSIVGIFVMRKSENGLKTVIPFGPFLALGSVLYLLGGHKLVFQYLRLFTE